MLIMMIIMTAMMILNIDDGHAERLHLVYSAENPLITAAGNWDRN